MSDDSDRTGELEQAVRFETCSVLDNLWTIKPANDLVMEYSCEENNEGLYDGTIIRWRVPKD